MSRVTGLQIRISQMSGRRYAMAVGLTLGLLGGLIGLLIAGLGPALALAGIGGLLAGLYIITDIRAALVVTLLTILLLPFGVFPVKIGLTPTLLDLALGALLLVYLFEWMTGRRRRLQLTPVHALVAAYIMWLLLTFALGLRHAMPTSADIRQFAETLLSIGLVFVIVDLLRDAGLLRRVTKTVMLALAAQAMLAIALFLMPDALAENLLVRLSRIGYPDGGVIRYIEDNPEDSERAIGSWVDPNALGGIMALGAALIMPQIVARQPLIGRRWLSCVMFAAVALALLLTSSRASLLAAACGLLCLALIRYRRLLPVLLAGGLAFALLPQTQGYIERLGQAFTGADLATQMRIGEWGDSLTLIGRYPAFGVGFTGTPEIDIYTDVANMYLIMANQIGLAGVALFLLTMGGVFAYGWLGWRRVGDAHDLAALQLGLHAALLTALINAVADLYFFRIDFQSSIAMFWLVVALCLACSRLILARDGARTRAA